jgi:HD-GYP domain-containing protein (c-di-GMP phosphodiesterase class II)
MMVGIDRESYTNNHAKDTSVFFGNKYLLKDIITVFCNTIDKVNPILENHHRRVAVISYYLGRELGLSSIYLTRLVTASALHDIGALTVEDRNQLIQFDVSEPEKHCDLGKSMLEGFAPFKEIADIIAHHHVNYERSKGDMLIPYESYIIHLADRVDILLDGNRRSINQINDVVNKIEEYEGSIFDPEIVNAFRKISDKEMFWLDIDNMPLKDVFNLVNLDDLLYSKDKESMEQLVSTLSKIVDYKSEFTAKHSRRVALLSGELARLMGYNEEHIWEVKIAGYLHDYGKIAVPTEIINKPGKLTEDEFNIIKSHPYFTYEILKDIKGLEKICRWASSHHEKLDHSGYPMKPEWSQMEEEIEILVYADTFTALAENRPYRETLPLEDIMMKLDKEFRPIVGERAYQVLDENKDELYRLILENID